MDNVEKEVIDALLDLGLEITILKTPNGVRYDLNSNAKSHMYLFFKQDGNIAVETRYCTMTLTTKEKELGFVISELSYIATEDVMCGRDYCSYLFKGLINYHG